MITKEQKELLEVAANLVTVAAGLIAVAKELGRQAKKRKPGRTAKSLASVSGKPEQVRGEGNLPAYPQYITQNKMSKVELFFLIGTPILLAIRYFNTEWDMGTIRQVGLGIITGLYLAYLLVIVKGRS